MSSVDFPTIPGYELLSVLGQGGMATVYEAVQENFGRRVALKVMLPEMSNNRVNDERFFSEARMVASLSHPNIITVYDVGQHNNIRYIAMEFHSGGHLGESKSIENLNHQQILTICLDIAKALQVAHAKGIIHRDLKPDNILFSQHGNAILTDFGIARDVHVDSQLTQVGLTVGTPKYMSPEQARGLKVDGRSDLYSLGIMMYEMLTGDVPFDDRDPLAIALKHCKEPAKPLPMTSARYQSIIDRLLMKSVEKRFQTAADLVMVLERFLTATSTSVPVALSEEDPSQFDALPLKKRNADTSSKSISDVLSSKTDVYHVVDEETGGFFSKKMMRKILFNADDFDAFNKKFQQASDGIKQWHTQYGKKATAVNFSIEAHPWIHKRVLDRFTSEFSRGHGFGDFAKQGTITLHLYDQINPTGKKFLIADQGVRPSRD